MDQLELHTEVAFARFVAERLNESGFVLIDVGAATGVATAWRCFGDKLCGYGFDPDAAEVARLNAAEPAPAFRYVAGTVGLSADQAFAQQRRGEPRLRRNPWSRLAIKRWLDIQQARDKGHPIPPVLPRSPSQREDRGEDEAEHPCTINLPNFLRTEGIGTVDFLKIDVDGTDFEILQSMAGAYREFGILGVGVEVNFFGSGAATDNTFHNIDRFLKNQGFELVDITVRRYPVQNLPGPSVAGFRYPVVCAFGRPYQGDAFYARDICAPWEWDFAASLDAERLAKAAALFALFGLPDCAAEILVTFRDRLTPLLEVDHGLELLTMQVQAGIPAPLSYPDYISRFETESYAPGGFYSAR